MKLFRTLDFSLENGFAKNKWAVKTDLSQPTVHLSADFNMNNIEQFTKSEIITGLNSVIPISRNRYIAFKETYFNYMFE